MNDPDSHTPGGDDWATDNPATHVPADAEWFPKPHRSHSATASAAAAAAEIAALRRELQPKPHTSWWRRMLAVFR